MRTIYKNSITNILIGKKLNVLEFETKNIVITRRKEILRCTSNKIHTGTTYRKLQNLGEDYQKDPNKWRYIPCLEDFIH